jgi:hypothetical protein
MWQEELGKFLLDYGRRIRRADHSTSLYPQQLAVTSPTNGGCSGGIVRSRTQATELPTHDVADDSSDIR